MFRGSLGKWKSYGSRYVKRVCGQAAGVWGSVSLLFSVYKNLSSTESAGAFVIVLSAFYDYNMDIVKGENYGENSGNRAPGF